MTVSAPQAVATQATQLPEININLKDAVLALLTEHGHPLSDRELTERLKQHPSNVRGAREKLVRAGLLQHVGFVRFNDGQKAHMTWAVVKNGQVRAQAEAVRKHWADCVRKISCLKDSAKTDSRELREIEVENVKRIRARATVIAG